MHNKDKKAVYKEKRQMVTHKTCMKLDLNVIMIICQEHGKCEK